MKKRNPSYDDLIRLCREDDMSAWARIAHRHRYTLYTYAIALLEEKDANTELILLTLLRLWKERKTIRPDTSLKIYFRQAIEEVIKTYPDKFIKTVQHESVAAYSLAMQG